MRRWLLALMLTGAPSLFILGLTLPLVRFEKLYFFSEAPSLCGIVMQLWRGGDGLLAVVVTLFSIVFPAVKMLLVAGEAVSATGRGSRSDLLERVLPILSKWSMTDVLIVALVIVAAKTSGIASAAARPGLWFYAGSALMVILAHGLARRARRC